MEYGELYDQLAHEIAHDIYKITREKLKKFEEDHFEFRSEDIDKWLDKEAYRKVRREVMQSNWDGLKKIIRKYGLKIDPEKFSKLRSLRVAILEKILLQY